MTYDYDRQDQDRQHRREAGMCLHCSAPAAPGRTRCEAHLKANAEAGRRYYAKKKARRKVT